MAGNWLRGLDLNQRPSGYEPDELPGCSTPRSRNDIIVTPQSTGQVFSACSLSRMMEVSGVMRFHLIAAASAAQRLGCSPSSIFNVAPFVESVCSNQN